MAFFTRENQKLIGQLLAPSFFSGTLAVLAGLVVSLGVLVAFASHNSAIQQQLLAWRPQTSQKALTTPDQTLVENDHPTLQGSWPLLIVWSGVGLVVYGIAVMVIHGLGSAKELSDELNYVNAAPHVQLEVAVEHLLLRVISAAILISLLVILVRDVLPYSITVADAAAGEITTGAGVLYALLSFAIIAVTVHLQTIFLRLTLGKVRVF